MIPLRIQKKTATKRSEEPVKILIIGGTGFVGSLLSRYLAQKGHEVSAVGHAPEPKPGFPSEVRYIRADTTIPGPWQNEIAKHDAVLNLAGESIFQRWNRKNKKRIYDSRIVTTRNIVEGMPLGHGPSLFNASAVGYYGFHKDELLTEEESPGKDFLAVVCRDWEHEALQARRKGRRVILLRFGIVLEKGGGALRRMLPLFRLGLGGPVGNGTQWFPWIHWEDLLNAFEFLLLHPEPEGAFNVCAPFPVRNRDFARTLGHVLHRPAFIRAPGFLIRVVLGEFGSVFLNGHRASPKKLIQYGFRFRYPEIRQALKAETK